MLHIIPFYIQTNLPCHNSRLKSHLLLLQLSIQALLNNSQPSFTSRMTNPSNRRQFFAKYFAVSLISIGMISGYSSWKESIHEDSIPTNGVLSLTIPERNCTFLMTYFFTILRYSSEKAARPLSTCLGIST